MFQIAAIAEMAPRTSFEFVADGGKFVQVRRYGYEGWGISQRAENGDYMIGCTVKRETIPAAGVRDWNVATVVGAGDDAEFVDVDSTRTVEAALSSALAYVLA
jgi:hypothetical protein